jgi:hypothetical protein
MAISSIFLRLGQALIWCIVTINGKPTLCAAREIRMQSTTTTNTLRDLVRSFNDGSILLPQFQRDYVWKANKIRNLLDSLFHDLPIGGFYVWQPTGKRADPKSKAFGRVKLSGPSSVYLIDGQQRLTSLEAAFGLFSGEDKRGDELQCYLDLSVQQDERKRDTRLFVSRAGRKSTERRLSNGDPTLIEVKRFFDDEIDYQARNETENDLRGLSGWTSQRVTNAMARYDKAYKMLSQHVPYTTVRDVTDDEAVDIFRRLNKGGTALREGDVQAAELARGPAVAVLKKMREFVLEPVPQRLGFGFSFAFRALVVFHQGSAQFKTLRPDWINAPGPHKRTLSESWQAAQKALTQGLKFIDDHMKWSRRALVPSSNAVIVLAFALDKMRAAAPAPDVAQMYRRWLCLTALRGVFQGSVESTIGRFLRGVRDSRSNPALALVSTLTRNEARAIQAEELTQRAQLWGPATQVFYSWLARRDARDWKTSESLDSLARANFKLPEGDLTVHHIFPRSIAAKVLGNPSDANCLANFAIISRHSNSEFGNKLPEDVLNNLDATEREYASLQFFSSDAGDRLDSRRYEEFRRWRAGQLADAFNEDLGIGFRNTRARAA